MLPRIVLSLFLVPAALALQAPSAPSENAYAGHVAQGVYHNDYFGMSFQVPKDWTTNLDAPDPHATRDELTTQQEKRRREVQTGLAFSATKRGPQYGGPAMSCEGSAACVTPLGGDLTTLRVGDRAMPDSIAVHAVPLLGREPVETRERRVNALRNGATDFLRAPEPVVLSRVALMRVDFQRRGNAFSRYITTLLAIRNGYLLELDFGSNDRKRLAALVQSVSDTLIFQPSPAH